MKNAMQLKTIIKNISKKKKISAQLILQNYMLERLLERVSLSKYHDNFILKGGFLIAAMVGLDTRATMDMDATIKGYPVTEETIKQMFEEICTIDVQDDIEFKFRYISEIREGDEYTGYRVALTANYKPMEVPLKLDITTGDVITPREICFNYPVMLEERNITVLAYNLETILAEKLETVISRADLNTRPRDYYDIYILYRLNGERVDIKHLKAALEATARKRGTFSVMIEYQTVMKMVMQSENMKYQWKNYKKDFAYAEGIDFEDACGTVVEIMNQIKEQV